MAPVQSRRVTLHLHLSLVACHCLGAECTFIPLWEQPFYFELISLTYYTDSTILYRNGFTTIPELAPCFPRRPW
jgi:hypothetical protein